MYKNINKREVLELKNEVASLNGQVISKTISQNESMSVTLFSFPKDEEISTHSAKGDAMLTVLEGMCRVRIESDEFILNKGETIIMPKDIPHSVYALSDFKMLLVISF